MSELGDVTAIIPNWNRADLLEKLLKQLAAQTYPIHRTLVMDNGSTDNSRSVAANASVEFVEMGSNTGFAPAVNRGIQLAKTPWIAILNNDVIPRPDWLLELVKAATSPETWFACGKLLSAGDATMLDGTFDAICRGGTAWRCGQQRKDGPFWSESRTIQFAPLTAVLFKREVFDRTGMLDERFESYLEDVDLGIRCAAARLHGVYAPTAIATHIGSATLGAWHTATVRRIARNQTFILLKYFKGGPLLAMLVAQLLWWFVAIRHGAGMAWLAGKWEGWRESHLFEPVYRWEQVRSPIEASERELHELQKQTGFDNYWRWYFALTGGM